ncbi:Aromatic-L-amino-acid decarboxylase [Enhygromyxa salina]|uniref:Aromatic-L-amino-acid decarboxylase n=1 Tax=Enhygromyxa salina TaxID=215803 RepID=A0A0C1ZS25_9BACT|nr:pyridoxal-dependent decarboxylase [Enhygromyxa salina]KIG13873.1 Aromatic-L-amino-acid decarboxylase [Enhygromyxa salina]
MSDPSYLAALEFLATLLPELAASEAAQPVRPPVPLDRAQALVPPLGAKARPLPEVLASLRALALNTPLTTTPQFFNQLFGGRDPAATAADMITAHLNVSMYTYKAAGPLVLVENALIEHMLAIAGFTAGEATFTNGGSLSNLLAVALARNEAQARRGDPDPDPDQAGQWTGKWALYTSAEAHYSMPKAATILGLGRGAVRVIEIDEQGRMIPAALAARLRADLQAGVRPVLINATLGTTVMGAFDPLEPIAEIANQHGIWLHADGALGGSLLLSRERRAQLFAGLERCDSLTWDAHKLMGVPLTCSALLLREPGLLDRHLGEDAHYLFQTDEDQLNPGLRSIQCGRRNDPLKLWAAWQHHGDDGYDARFAQLFALRDHVVARIDAHPDLRMSHAPQSLNVCFEMDGVSSEQLCLQLNQRGLAVVGYGRVNGRDTIRLVIANPAQTSAVLDQFLEDLVATGSELRRASS